MGKAGVIIVGASVAGCTAATFLGRQGVGVTLLERASDPRTYKKVCTHFIQASATPTLERLGMIGAIESAGGVRNYNDSCTRLGWMRDGREHYGYNLRRSVLDPLLREQASKTPGVALRMGHTVEGLLKDGDRVAGVIAKGPNGERVELRARLVVAADGRHGKLGDMAGVPAEVRPNNRFIYFGYYRLATPLTKSFVWFRDPDVCYAFQNDDGLACLATMPTKEKLPAFRRDLEGSFTRMLEGLPEGPDLSTARREGELLGMIEMPNAMRRASAPGIALVGDAALASDPVLGVGCGWALQTGEWLALDVGPALVAGEGLDEALAVYARHHVERLAAHHGLVCKFSVAKPFNFVERALFHAAASDRDFRMTMSRLGARILNPREMNVAGFLSRALWLRATRKALEPVALSTAPSLS
jgi:2-polyprenyl-6-methoxyphenol hydroxylase-like FAD-dependent oxidoreductase